MKKGYKKLLIFILVLFIVLFTNTFFINFLSGYKIILLLIALLVFFNFYFVMEKDRHRYFKDILFEIFFYTVMFFILYYLLGILTGLARTPNYFTIDGMKNIILPIILYNILREVFRYNMLCKSDGNKLCTVSVVLLFICFDLTNSFSLTRLKTQYDVLRFVALTFLPVITRNICYSYISKKMGYKPVIIFDLIFTLYPYIIPILPNPSEYVVSVIYLLTPLIFTHRILKFFELKKDDKIPNDYRKQRFKGLLLPVVIIMILVYFYSGYFRFYAIAIASGSMVPKIYKGDIVIVDQKYKKPKVGDVIAFKHDHVIVVHRIVKKIKYQDHTLYYTKGDANEHMDDFIVEKDIIIGKVTNKIPYAGWPTVWFNEK